MLAMFCLAMKREVYEGAPVGALDSERFGGHRGRRLLQPARGEGMGDPRCRRRLRPPLAEGVLSSDGSRSTLALFRGKPKKYEENGGEGWKAEGVDVWKRADLGYQEQLDAVRRRVADSRSRIFLRLAGPASPSSSGPPPGAHAGEAGLRRDIWTRATARRVNGFKGRSSQTSSSSAARRGCSEQIPGALLWAFPHNWPRRTPTPRGRDGYDWIDDLEVFRTTAGLEKNHARALAEATVVGSVARKLHAQALAGTPRPRVPPNGSTFERFATRTRRCPRRQGSARVSGVRQQAGRLLRGAGLESFEATSSWEGRARAPGLELPPDRPDVRASLRGASRS